MATATTEVLQERVSLSPGGRVDHAAGVIRGVKLIGLESINGRSYPIATLREAAEKYEGVKVNVNHPKGSPRAARDYQDRLGSIQGVRVEADGLFADLRYNPCHAVGEQLAWDAEHAPENVGLSHNVEVKTSRHHDGRVVVESITKVFSVDLVADPATTQSLFESRQTEQEQPSPYAGIETTEEFVGFLKGRDTAATEAASGLLLGHSAGGMSTADFVAYLKRYH